jgi:hypothetical protein
MEKGETVEEKYLAAGVNLGVRRIAALREQPIVRMNFPPCCRGLRHSRWRGSGIGEEG